MTKTDKSADKSSIVLYPRFESVDDLSSPEKEGDVTLTKMNTVQQTTPVQPSTPQLPTAQACVVQQTTVNYHRNGHSRNPSSINGITIATQVIQPPPNKPDAINNLLKLIRFRSDCEESEERSASRKICGIQEARLIMMFILIVVFLMSGTVFVVMWFTEFYNDSIISSLVLEKNSTAFKYFKTPPLNPQLRVHIFNYTNTERFLSGEDDKLIVQDVGPYVYTEKTQKVDVVYNDNNTISYREYRSFDFRPEASHPRFQFDRLIVPNVPLITAAWQLPGKQGFEYGMMYTFLMSALEKPFKNLSAHEFLWGYTDSLIQQSKFDKFGMLVTRNGTSAESFTINSGVGDIRKLNVIDNFNGQPKMNFWSTNECNRVDGTDGSQFPPYLMDKKQPLQVFIKAFCRKFPMVYDSEVNLFNGVPAWRYKAPRNVFDHPFKNAENGCYCSGKCPPSGVFNATLCFDAPIYSSFPHFLYGDDILFDKIDGLSPNENDHLTYADVHPRLAFPMAGSSRFQINIQVQSSTFTSDKFTNDMILPLIWMEVTSDEVPETLRAMIYHSTFSANAIQLSLRYGSLFGLLVSIMLLVAGCYLKAGEDGQLARSNGIRNIMQGDRVTIEETVTIDLNDPSRTIPDSNYPVKE